MVLRFFVLDNKAGRKVINAMIDAQKITAGIDFHPNNNPTIIINLASPKPIASIPFNFLQIYIINQIIKNPKRPPTIESIWLNVNGDLKLIKKFFIKDKNINEKVSKSGIIKCFKSIKKIIIKIKAKIFKKIIS